jgi:hypothetical protein
MNRIHLIEKGNFPENLVRIDKENHVYDSGFWFVAQATAERLVGGNLYLHDAQDKPARFGGNILSYRVAEDGANEGKIVFRFQASMDARGTRTGREGWGMEKKIVLDDPYPGTPEADR